MEWCIHDICHDTVDVTELHRAATKGDAALGSQLLDARKHINARAVHGCRSKRDYLVEFPILEEI